MILTVEGDSHLSVLATAVVSPCSDVGVKIISVEEPLGNVTFLVESDVVVRNLSSIVEDLSEILLAEEELEAAEVVSNDCLAILRHERSIKVILEYAAVRINAAYVRNVNVELS